MRMDRILISLLTLAALTAGGCSYENSRSAPPPPPSGPPVTIQIDQVPPSIVSAMRFHIYHGEILGAQTMKYRGDTVYKLLVKSGNNLYYVNMRADGNYLGMTQIGEHL